ncbi:MAG: general secretion pathway protein GspE [Desulfotalea sp.]|nr:MAG: general secretion pathway protein GspE [Desulfotalea sp.]
MFGKTKEQFNTVQEIDTLIRAGIDLGASDIHIEPFEDFIRVRLRIDGTLTKFSVLPIAKRDEITAILKVMAGLDSTQKRQSQDGKIKFAYLDMFVEIRISVLPFKYGEKIVLRIQNTERIDLNIDNLGINENCLINFKKSITSKQGLILITGSTGTGKTTTVYSALNYIRSDELNIVTLEDPIEYEIPGFIQIQLSKELNMNYADILRAVLRQDPDILVIGEIRDTETAKVAIGAALTGHLIIASLHTNDSIDTIVRLREMGIEAYLIAAALKFISYQILLRILCPTCKRPSTPNPEHIAMFNLPEDAKVFTSQGCKHCNNTGFKGRKPVFEILIIDEEIIDILATTTTGYNLKKKLKHRIQSNLFIETKKQILAGVTSCTEAAKQLM